MSAQPRPKLARLRDVDRSTTPGDGAVPTWNPDTLLFEWVVPAAAAHTHPQSDVTGLVAALGGKAPAVHVHSIADVTALQAALDARQVLAEKNAANGYAGLDDSGKLTPAQLPALAISSVVTVGSQAAQLALTAQEGDVAVRTDESKAYIHNGGSAGTMADWTLLATPADTVLSVAGKTGAVALVVGDIGGLQAALDGKADDADVTALDADLDAHTAATNNPHAVTKAQVGLSNADNTSDANKPVSAAQQAALDAKQPLNSDLSAIAALATTAFGRALLESADATAVRTAIAAAAATHAATHAKGGADEITPWAIDAVPARIGSAAETGPRQFVTTSAAPTAGRVHLVRIRLKARDYSTLTIQKGGTAGSGVASAFFGIYPIAGGAALATSSDRSADINGTAASSKVPAIPLAVTIPAEGDYWLAFLIGSATTMPSLIVWGIGSVVVLQDDIPAEGVVPLVGEHSATGLTALPANLARIDSASPNLKTFWARLT